MGKILGRWEREGQWPEQKLRNALYAMIPKAKALNESQLRHIGPLPYAYRVVMVFRREWQREWSLGRHGGRHVGGAILARRMRASVEVLQSWPAHIDGLRGRQHLL